MAVTSPSDFRPFDVGATLRTWGLRSGDPCNQFLGSVSIRSGLAIAFPNIYQHRFTACRLQPGQREGRLSTIAFFLIDPDSPRVVSTADVPPQQRAWIFRVLESSLDERFPTEVIEKIVSEVDDLMTDEEANVFVEEMQRERADFTKYHDARYFSLPFDIGVTG